MSIVRDLPERAGLTQSLLAKLSGVSTRTISEYESGRGESNAENAHTLGSSGKHAVVLTLSGT